mgnify:CR=1 FL=1
MNDQPRPIKRGYLQLKLGTLAAEAKLIRRKEAAIQRAQRRSRDYAALKVMRLEDLPGFLEGEAAFKGLVSHRKIIVRREARDSNLAYGFLRGNPYNAMEKAAYEMPNWKNIESIVKRFDDLNDWRVTGQRFSQWLASARVINPITGQPRETP